jgi:putative redox protein
MPFSATAVNRDTSLRAEIDVNGRHSIVTDEPADLGGEDTAPAPHELLPAMLASCISTMVSLYARRKGWELGEVRVDVDYEYEVTPRRLEVDVHLPAGLSDEQAARLERVARTCPVGRAFEAGFTLEERIHVGQAAPA